MDGCLLAVLWFMQSWRGTCNVVSEAAPKKRESSGTLLYLKKNDFL